MGGQAAAGRGPSPGPTTAEEISGGDRSGRFKQLARPEKAMLFPRDRLTAEEVFRAHAQRVYRLALRLLGSTADAEDVTREVLLQLVRKLDAFRGESSLTAGLHRMTVNAALAHRRRQARPPEPPPDVSLDCIAPSGAGAGPDSQALRGELRSRLKGAGARLPQRLPLGGRDHAHTGASEKDPRRRCPSRRLPPGQ
jgi:RNA polymerase sigma-70 factor (ECF subfamily)